MGKLNNYLNNRIENVLNQKLITINDQIIDINKNTSKLHKNIKELNDLKKSEKFISKRIEEISNEINQIKDLVETKPIEEAEDVSMFYENEIYMNEIRVYSRKDIGNFCININDPNANHRIYLNSTKENGKIFINLSGKNNVFKIGKNNKIRNDIVIEYWGCCPNIFPKNVTIEIGNNNYFNGEKIKFISPIEDGKKIKIGDYNLFAGYITFRGRNDHVIYDTNTMERTNIDHDIIINNNVWVCDSVVFLPKTVIKGNAVIAEHSLVNKEFKKENILIAGIPAVIKKNNIMWHIDLNDSYKQSEYPISNKE